MSSINFKMVSTTANMIQFACPDTGASFKLNINSMNLEEDSSVLSWESTDLNYGSCASLGAVKDAMKATVLQLFTDAVQSYTAPIQGDLFEDRDNGYQE